jgi:hypothetical protein
MTIMVMAMEMKPISRMKRMIKKCRDEDDDIDLRL